MEYFEQIYKNALEKARMAILKCRPLSAETNVAVSYVLVRIFPELAEGEEFFVEELRNHIHDFARSIGGTVTKKDNISRDAIVDILHRYRDWSEKQKREQKSMEWSEEDERNKYRAVLYARYYQRTNGVTDGPEECIDWLKSLRPQPHWKPTEEQMGIIKEVLAYFGESWVSRKQQILESLYEDLKKLM